MFFILLYIIIILFLICVCACVCFAASLFVQGPTESVMEGDRVTLECLDSESEMNMTSLHFEKMSRVRIIR